MTNAVIPIKGPVIVLFTGKNCPPCEALKPLLAAEVTRRPGVAYVVLSPSEQTMSSYRDHGVRSSPTVLYLNNGAEVGRFTGYRDAGVLAETLNRWHVN